MVWLDGPVRQLLTEPPGEVQCPDIPNVDLCVSQPSWITEESVFAAGGALGGF